MEDNNENLGLKYYLNLFKDWASYFFIFKKIIIVSVIIGSIFGLLYSTLNKPVYKAKLSFALDGESGGGLTGALALAGSFGLDIGKSAGGAFSGTNIIELMKSRVVFERALLKPDSSFPSKPIIDRLLVSKKNKILNNDSLFKLNDDVNNLTRQQDSITKMFYNGFLLSGDFNVEQLNSKSSIISINVKSKDEKFAKYFSEAIAETITELYVSNKSEKARLNLSIIEKQVDSIRNELNKSILKSANETDQVFGLNPALNVERIDFLKSQVDLQANTTILTELVKNLELARLTLLRETPLIQIIDRPKFPLDFIYFRKLKGIIFGGILGGFLSICILIFLKFYNEKDKYGF
jgi:uncharacterized protein involved in exopolysaccharide biosynthesis